MMMLMADLAVDRRYKMGQCAIFLPRALPHTHHAASSSDNKKRSQRQANSNSLTNKPNEQQLKQQLDGQQPLPRNTHSLNIQLQILYAHRYQVAEKEDPISNASLPKTATTAAAAAAASSTAIKHQNTHTHHITILTHKPSCQRLDLPPWVLPPAPLPLLPRIATSPKPETPGFRR